MQATLNRPSRQRLTRQERRAQALARQREYQEERRTSYRPATLPLRPEAGSLQRWLDLNA